MDRCYVCRRPTNALTNRKGRKVCGGCADALPRVLTLEARELKLCALVETLKGKVSAVDEIRADAALSEVSSTQGSDFDLDDVTRLLSRANSVLEPTSGLGHALETLVLDHQLTVGQHQTPTYACIMPGCELCAVAGSIREMLDRMLS